MRHQIRADIDAPGMGQSAYEKHSCWLKRLQPGNVCPLCNCECYFGLTEAEVPRLCPLRSGVTIILSVVSKASEEESQN